MVIYPERFVVCANKCDNPDGWFYFGIDELSDRQGLFLVFWQWRLAKNRSEQFVNFLFRLD